MTRSNRRRALVASEASPSTAARRRPIGFSCRALPALCFAVLAACGDDETPEDQGRSGYDYEVDLAQPPPEPLVLAANSRQLDIDCASGLFCFQGACTYQCADDADCEPDQVCAGRGRCLERTSEKSSDESGSVIDVIPGVRITDTPDRQHAIQLGQTELEITLGTNREVPVRRRDRVRPGGARPDRADHPHRARTARCRPGHRRHQ